MPVTLFPSLHDTTTMPPTNITLCLSCWGPPCQFYGAAHLPCDTVVSLSLPATFWRHTFWLTRVHYRSTDAVCSFHYILIVLFISSCWSSHTIDLMLPCHMAHCRILCANMSSSIGEIHPSLCNSNTVRSNYIHNSNLGTSWYCT